jgi:hypothetical protein
MAVTAKLKAISEIVATDWRMPDSQNGYSRRNIRSFSNDAACG